jgi:hypothetical protein
MGDGENVSLRLQFNPKVRLEFHGSTVTSDAGLLAFRELDDALGLTSIACDYFQESRTGRNIQHQLVPLLRQAIFSRLAGYDDTNDAQRLAQDPAMRVVVGWQGSERNAASTSEMSRFETEILTQEGNLRELEGLNVEWVKRPSPARSTAGSSWTWTVPRARYTASRKEQPTTVISSASVTTHCSASTSLEIVKGRSYDRAMSTVLKVGRNLSSLS